MNATMDYIPATMDSIAATMDSIAANITSNTTLPPLPPLPPVFKPPKFDGKYNFTDRD